MKIMKSQKSVGGSDESVLLCGRWFGIGKKCGHSQIFKLLNCREIVVEHDGFLKIIFFWSGMLRVSLKGNRFISNKRCIIIVSIGQ